MNQNKRLIILVSTMLMVILLGSIFGIESYKPKYAYTSARLNFRRFPDTNTIPIKVLSKSEHIKIVGSYKDFHIVQLEDNLIGYVSKNYVIPTNNKPNTKTYYSYTPYFAKVKYDVVNVRKGPSTNHLKLTKVYKGDIVTVIGRIDDFLAIIQDNDRIGMIQQDLLVRTDYPSTPPSNSDSPSITTSNEDVIINYINNERTAKGLNKLVKGVKLSDIAKRKSIEMAEKDYFLHTSPTYGTPFTMMKNFGINYITAGENIAGNDNLKKAVDNWMNSTTHSKNILSTSYNYIGCGVSKDERYGYLISVMFVQQ